MKKLLIYSALFGIIFSNGSLISQDKKISRYMIIRTAPSYTISFDINTNQSIFELSGTYNDDVHSTDILDGATFGADKGFGAHIISKINLSDKGNIRFFQVLAFNRILSYTFGTKENLFDKGKANYNAYTAGLGIEYNFTPKHKFKLYTGAELNASMINGTTTIWFYSTTEQPTTIDYKIKNSFRMGYGLNVGAEYLLNNSVGVNVGVRFVNLNVFIKSAKGTNLDTEFQLRDDDNPNLNFAGKKNFSFYSILAGVNFYFGVGEKRYKIK